MAKAQERALQLRLHRISLQSAGLEVVSPRPHPPPGQAGFGPVEGGRFGMLSSKLQGKKKAPQGGSHMV
jgi:hypothetical protein